MWVDNFTQDHIADGTYTLLDVEDTGVDYVISGGRCIVPVTQYWADQRFPVDNRGNHSVSVTLDESSGPPVALSVGWVPKDVNSNWSSIYALLNFNSSEVISAFQDDYSTQLLVDAFNGHTREGSYGTNDRDTLKGLTPPYTLAISIVDTGEFRQVKMTVDGNGGDGSPMHYEAELTAIGGGVWDIAFLPAVYPFINIISFGGRWKEGSNLPPVALKEWTHDTPIVSTVFTGQPGHGLVRRSSRVAGASTSAVQIAPVQPSFAPSGESSVSTAQPSFGSLLH